MQKYFRIWQTKASNIPPQKIFFGEPSISQISDWIIFYVA